jgi:hypothetical protein
VNLPPVVTAFEPVELSPVIATGNRMTFAVAARDPEEGSLAYTFTVNDSLVATQPQFSFLAGAVGIKAVRVLVTDGENFASRQWNLKVTAVPDTIAPAEVPIVSYAPGVNPGEVELEWLAVGRDGMLGRPSAYEVRTSPVPILTEEDWQRASDRPGVPDPAQPGESMQMTLGGLLPARETYLAVRAIDDFGNISPLGTPVLVRTRGMRFGGRVIDALTGLGIPNAVVSLGLFESVTDADGRYAMDDLGPIEGTLAARDDDEAGTGAYFDYERYYFVRQDDVVDFILLPNRTMQSAAYTDFLQFYRAMTEIPGNPYGAEQRRWNLPINLFIRPYGKDGLDYRAVIERVAAEFDAILGTRVFNIVETRPLEGVEVVYRDGLAQDNYGVTEWTSDWYPRMALIQFRTVYTPSTVGVLEVTARHELGHAIGLGHSVDTLHLMVGGPAPSARVFSPDEVAISRCLYGIPRGWDVRKFNRQ